LKNNSTLLSVRMIRILAARPINNHRASNTGDAAAATAAGENHAAAAATPLGFFI
jgi:hypothetical protein